MASSGIPLSDRILALFQKPRKLKLSDMVILGFLTYNRMSGYDIYRKMEKKVDWVGSFVNLNKATVYNTVNRLEKRGLIAVAEKIEDEKKPAKYIYEITEKGREYFRELLHIDGRSYPLLFINAYYDYIFYKDLGKEEIRELVELRIKQMEIVVEIFEIYVKYNRDNIGGLIFESEKRMYEEILETSRRLLKMLDEKPLEEIFDIKYMFGKERPEEIYELMSR